MQSSRWFRNWLELWQPERSTLTPFDFAATLSSMRLEDRRVLSVSSVLSAGILQISLNSAGDTASLSVTDVGGVATIHVTDQAHVVHDFNQSAVNHIDIAGAGAAASQSVLFDGPHPLDVGSLAIHNVADVTIQSPVMAHNGPVSIIANHDVNMIGIGSLTADDPASSSDHLNISISAGNHLLAQQVSATGSVQLSAATGLNVADASATHAVHAGTGISIVVTGSGSEFFLDPLADLDSQTGGVSILADEVSLAGTIAANGQTVSLAPTTFGHSIDLGTHSDGPTVLGLSSNEISHIAASSISIGNGSSGDIAISAAIHFAVPVNLSLTTGDHSIAFQGGSLDAHGGDIQLLTGPGGHVSVNSGGLDLVANSLSIVAGAGIGSNSHPLLFDVSVLTTDSSARNGGQFLSDVASTGVGTAGLNAGSGVIDLLNGTFVSGGSERIGNASSVTVGAEATLDFHGFKETLANLTSQGAIILGPLLTDTGSLNLSGSATLSGAINGATPVTGFDQIIAGEPISIGLSALHMIVGWTLTVGNHLTLLHNTGSGIIGGSFNGLAEGSVFNVGATTFSISYVGGAGGHDIVLTVAATPTNVTKDGSGNLVVSDQPVGGNNDKLTIQSDTVNARYIISDPINLLSSNIAGATVSSDLHTVTVPFAVITGSQILVNTYGGDDSLTVDLSLGDFAKSIRYDGGTQGVIGDSLTLVGGSTFASVAHQFLNSTSGTVSVSGNAAISYTNVEPIFDNLNAIDRVFTFSTASAAIDLVSAGAGLKLGSTQSDSVTFVDPTHSLTINGGTGNDVITVSSVDPGYRASLTIDGASGNDTINLNGPLVLGSTTSTGSLTVTAEQANQVSLRHRAAE